MNDTETTTLTLSKEDTKQESAATYREQSPKEQALQHERAIAMQKVAKSLKKCNYRQISSKFPNKYILRHKQHGLVIEIQAASSTHACTLAGWRPRQVELVSISSAKNDKESPSKENADIQHEVSDESKSKQEEDTCSHG